MKKLLLKSFIGIIVIGVISSCKEKERNDELNRNSEKLIYQKSANEKETNLKGAIDLQDQITKTVQIRYENDLLVGLRNQKNWTELLDNNKAVLDKENITKTSIAQTAITLLTIPFKSTQEQGFFNVYQLNGKYFWTKVVVTELPNHAKSYTIVSADGERLMKLDLDRNFKASNFTAAQSNKVLAKNPEFSTALYRLAEAEKECYKIKGATYWDCLTCVLIKHCGNDLACVIACTIAPEVCLGVAILACLPTTIE
jgi:hypothetical protein